MSRALEMLRAMAREEPACSLYNERNEINEITSHAESMEGVNSFLSFSSLPGTNEDNLEERASIVEYDAGVPRDWADGFAALSTMPAPAGFLPDRWRRIVDAAGHFLDHWAVHAAERGWSALDVFGCHSTRPDARFDCMGLLLLLDRHKVVAIDANGADLVTPTGAKQRFYRRAAPAGAIALWDLVRQSAGAAS